MTAQLVVRVKAEGEVPEYKSAGAAGMDLKARLETSIILKPGGRALVPTGVKLELPEGYEAQVRARSGLAAEYGIGLVNGIGTIDSDYRGEIKICLINLGERDFLVSDGDRVAQLVIARYVRAELEVCETLSDSERGTGGFGSTGA